MAGHGFTEKSFAFFEGLAENNNKEWFHAHKAEFKDYVEAPFLDLLDALTERLADAEVPLQGNPKTKFRMNRDVRFSEDKSPYKTSIAAVLTPSGTKRETGGLLYVHMEAKGGFAGTGWHNLAPKALKPFREAMVDEAEAFDDVRASLDKAGRALSTEYSLTSMPRGFEPQSEHRHADAIKLKSLLVSEDLPKVAFTSGDVVDRVEKMARDAMPFLVWGRKVSA
ncbi:DUF2461 domain-containing protein [Pseudaestuariivita sp.]|uniref:DUF2461 domain-containing protein n=1 Tax=Pseudaestuariivita sp. TaxID=2211669 RepID=UPI004059B9C7